MVGDCPHDRDPEDCEATEYGHYYDCPSSLSPHTIRRGAITHQLRADISEKIASDRCDVSSEILERHYDRHTDRKKWNSGATSSKTYNRKMTLKKAAVSTVVSLAVRIPTGNGIRAIEGLVRQIPSGLAGIEQTRRVCDVRRVYD
ncbi:hypothetical protein [Natronorubrum sp. DTA7]|uniref:hypothetical protein n=1 Tax=Natronorubrum sp. DTA7 TaxID=3447016 RepID=UPI003F86C0C9